MDDGSHLIEVTQLICGTAEKLYVRALVELFNKSGAIAGSMSGAAVFLTCATLVAADDLSDLFRPTPSPLERELQPIYEKLHMKLLTGPPDRGGVTNELNAIEAALKRHPEERPEKIAQVRYELAVGYWRVFNDPTQGVERLQAILRDFPQSATARKAALDLEIFPKIDAGIALRQTIEVGKPLPDFEVRDMTGRTMSVSRCRGKAVLIMSWDINTAPLLQFDKLLDLQKKYEPDTFEVIGLNQDQDEARVREYLKANSIPWRQYCDGRGVHNELVLKYHLKIASYAFVLDRQGRVVAIEPDTLEELRGAIIEALKK